MIQWLPGFTLDLFGPKHAAPALPRKAASTTEKFPVSDQKEAAGQTERGLTATKKIAKPVLPGVEPAHAFTSPALTPAVAPTTFCHPHATCQTLLDGVLVAYALRRGKRRTIGFSAGPDGLTVSAPKWVPLYEIDQAVLEKSRWILKKLQETRDRHQQLQAASIDWKDGCCVPFLGEHLKVVLEPCRAVTGAGSELKKNLPDSPPTLHLALPQSATAAQIRDAVQAWLMQQAKQIFTERLDHFAPAVRVQWRKLGLSSASTRWGSASANGSIRLNWRLVHFTLPVIDYVVVHELSHLQVMDHSPRFWDTVRAVMPDYADLRRHLKHQRVPCW